MNVTIIDYGSGNLRSVTKAFEFAQKKTGGGSVIVSSDPNKLINASHIVLPGQGSFADCKSGLLAIDGMAEMLHQQVIKNAKPFLGICVGMQLMADISMERDQTYGLGWIPGEVVEIIPQDKHIKIPHMGWNALRLSGSTHPVVAGLTNGAHVYFVHSYNFVAKKPSHVLGTVKHGSTITAIVGHNNLLGAQFHPEKSQAEGLKFIESFLTWQP